MPTTLEETEATSVGHRPEEAWRFDEAVTRVFDDMLRRSIPQYETMRACVFALARQFVKPKTDVVDLGCSRGAALAPLVDQFGAHNRFLGVDVSEPMLRASRERFAGYIRCGVVDIREHDLRRGVPRFHASVVLAILTLQFTPIEHRQKIVQGVFDQLALGGVFIMVEKVLGETASMHELFTRRYHDLKSENGYSADDIERKRESLEGVLVPVTAQWNEEMLRAAGFRQVACFWRWMNFAGWLAVK